MNISFISLNGITLFEHLLGCYSTRLGHKIICDFARTFCPQKERRRAIFSILSQLPLN